MGIALLMALPVSTGRPRTFFPASVAQQQHNSEAGQQKIAMPTVTTKPMVGPMILQWQGFWLVPHWMQRGMGTQSHMVLSGRGCLEVTCVVGRGEQLKGSDIATEDG